MIGGRGSVTNHDLGMTQETKIFWAVRFVIDQQGLFPGGMRIVAAGTSKFLPPVRGVKMSHDGMIITEPITTEDVLSVGFVGMTILADQTDLLVQETRCVRRMGIMAGQAIASRNRRMDVLL